jgi:hypothetical protein
MDSAGVFFRSCWDDCITKLENLGILLTTGEINFTSIVTIVFISNGLLVLPGKLELEGKEFQHFLRRRRA